MIRDVGLLLGRLKVSPSELSNHTVKQGNVVDTIDLMYQTTLLHDLMYLVFGFQCST